MRWARCLAWAAMATSDDQLKGVAEYAKAAREFDSGHGTCRSCKEQFPVPELIALIYGGGPLYAVCIRCISRGRLLIVARTSRGIEAKLVDNSPIQVRSGG